MAPTLRMLGNRSDVNVGEPTVPETSSREEPAEPDEHGAGLHPAAELLHQVVPSDADPAPPESAKASPPPSGASARDNPIASMRKPRAGHATRARRCATCNQTFSGDSRFCPFDGTPLADAPDWNPAADPLLGRTIDSRYDVQSVVGEGGMGTVYEVRHKSLGRLFAMKVLRRDIAQDAELVARFIQEAKAAAAIGHPNIVAVSDFGALEAEPGQSELPFFVMEFLTGSSLASLLRTEKTLPTDRVARIMLQCAAALGAAHAVGVIHRDLKPDNIYLVRNGEQEFVKLLDFGVAKIDGGKRLTRIGMVFGTPHYMSPEQAEGKRIDPRADIYALGVIMYECFAGHVPFEADTYMGVLTKHMYVVPEPVETQAPDASALGPFGAIVMRCLAKSPEERFPSMAELAAAIELALESPSRAASLLMADEQQPRRDVLRLRDRDEMLGPIQVPPEPPEPSSTTARIALALAAIAMPIVLAYGYRAYRTARAQVAPLPLMTANAPELLAPAPLPAASMSSGAVASAPQPLATALPVAAPPSSTASPAPGPLPAAVAKPANAASRPAQSTPPAMRSTSRGEIVDPWEH